MNIIKKLNNIDIKELKNMDFNEVKNSLRGSPEILISILLIGASLFAIINNYNSNKIKVAEINTLITELREKQGVVEVQNKVQDEYKAFMASFPKFIPSDQLIDKVSAFAVNHNVQILSFSPAKEQASAHVQLTSIEINVSSSEYDNLIEFIRAIENSPYTIRIEKWLGTMQDTKSRGRRSENLNAEEDQVQANIQIGSVKLLE